MSTCRPRVFIIDEYGREFAFDPEFEEHCTRLKGDGMNKRKAGVLTVSLHHQVYRRYRVDDSPNYNDHDFPFPGYLLAPFGLMFMAKPGSKFAKQLDAALQKYQLRADAIFEDDCHPLVNGALRAQIRRVSRVGSAENGGL